MTCEPRNWSRNPMPQVQNWRIPRLREVVIVKFMLRTLAAAALVVSATNVGQCATAGSRSSGQGAAAGSRLSSKKPPAGTTPVESTLAHVLAQQISKPKVALRKGAPHTAAAAAGQKGGVAGDPHKGVAGDPQKGGVVAAQKGRALAAVMPMQHAPAAGVLRAAPPATHVLPAVSRPPAIQVKPPPATMAHDGALSGARIKPHPSALVALGGAETGKGTAVINGASVRPKGH
jgi:hypothetical protein